jgi:hypothetical protein
MVWVDDPTWIGGGYVDIWMFETMNARHGRWIISYPKTKIYSRPVYKSSCEFILLKTLIKLHPEIESE